MKSIAIILTVYNRKQKTLKCLQRLYDQLPVNGIIVDIYLTNDGCTDGTPDAINKDFPKVKIINGDGNLYWNRGMFLAWKEAAKKGYDFYLWLNDDTFVYNNLLINLLNASKIKNHKSIIVGATQSAISHTATYGGRLANGKIPEPNGELIKIHHFNGNIVLIPRYVYNILGNLDYYYTHSKGDFDYGLRANKQGIEMFQADSYLGECELHETLDKWCNPEIPFKQRWLMLHRPNGMPPKETFHLEKKHKGIIIALFHYCTIYIRCLLPKLWIK